MRATQATLSFAHLPTQELHPGFIQSCRQRSLAPVWPQFRCVGTWVCRWRTLRGTGERDNLRASPFSGVIHLVTWGTVALRMHLTQWAVSLIPLFSVLRTTQTLFDAIITVKVPASAAPSLPAATITPKSSSDKLEIIVSLGEQTLKLKISTYFICPCRECLFLSLII